MSKALALLFFLPLMLAVSLTAAQCNDADKKALLAIAANFDNPSTLSQSWIPTTDCCGWAGIGCDRTTGRVTNFVISNDRNLTGTISPAIADLPELLNFIISEVPNLVGTIPSSITKLNKLLWLQLDHTSLSGPIPTYLSELTALTILNLSHNKFTGLVPPSLVNLGNTLGALVLSHNKLTGQIPESFGSFPKMPGTLFLDHNKLSGPIPRSLGGPEWPFIDLSHNRLTGDASFLFGSGKATRIMNLQKNMLSFDLTSVSFPVNLSTLQLNNNYIYGSIPAQINQVTGLEVRKFNVSNNLLCGPIPAGPVTAMFDQSAYANNKCLCGSPLPPCN